VLFPRVIARAPRAARAIHTITKTGGSMRTTASRGLNRLQQGIRRAACGAGLALALCASTNALAQAGLPPKLSTHALDTFSGKQAAGMKVDLYMIEGSTRTLIKSVVADADGRVEGNLLEGPNMKVGRYELLFYVSDYYKKMGIAQSNPEFLDVVPIRIAIFDATQRYHVPLYFSPWSYMTYRGS
jgi:5-hydroxyisourate hydrolase